MVKLIYKKIDRRSNFKAGAVLQTAVFFGQIPTNSRKFFRTLSDQQSEFDIMTFNFIIAH